jgi:hypothetical protein
MSKVELMILLSTLSVSATAANAADAKSPIPQPPKHALIRQGRGMETLLGDSPQRILPLKRGSASANAAVALETAAATGAGIIGGAPARLAVPYAADGAAKAAHAGKTLVTGHGRIVKSVELDALPGTTAGVSLLAGDVEIVIPLNEYIPSAEAVMHDVRPVLLKLEPSIQDQTRLLAARHIELRPQKSGRLHLASPHDRIEVEVIENVVPTSFEKLADNVYRISSVQPLKIGEYALVFRTKAPSGRYTDNVVLRSAIRTAGEGPETTSHGAKLADLISPPKKPNPAKEPRTTDFIAFDFRLLP